jgi:ABC-type dipeptide/oligopeptide/nickel transport system permease subunit
MEERTIQGIEDSLFQFASTMSAGVSTGSQLIVLGSSLRISSRTRSLCWLYPHGAASPFHVHKTYLLVWKDPVKVTSTGTGRQLMNQRRQGLLFGTTTSAGPVVPDLVGHPDLALIALIVGVWELGFGILFGALWGYVRNWTPYH